MTIQQLASQVKSKLEKDGTMTTKSTTNTASPIQQLKALGFSNEIQAEPRRIILSLSGKEKTGKTHFSFTAPDPIFLFNIDIGTEGVIGKFQRAGKQIYSYDIRVRKGEKQEIYQTMWADLRTRLAIACKVGEGTIVFDTASEVYELARLAHFGKLSEVKPHHYGEVNGIWREMMRVVYDSTMNAIFIHKVKPKWENNIRTKEYEVAGFSDTGYMVQVNATTLKERKPDGEGVDFSLSIDNCRKPPELEGMVLRGEMCNFEMLLGLVHDN